MMRLAQALRYRCVSQRPKCESDQIIEGKQKADLHYPQDDSVGIYGLKLA